MERGIQGYYVQLTKDGKPYQAFVPSPLSKTQTIQRDENLYEQALVALGRLDAITTLLPDTGLFLYLYVRKEAVLSSQIEGTQSSFADLLLYEASEAPRVPLYDVEEVSSYVAALNQGMVRLSEGIPICNRLIRELHAILLSKGRGSNKTPGNFRREPNWIGGATPDTAIFVPPPFEEIESCMADLEKFLNNDPARTPALIKAALAHVQFETIHPFLDGNGRLGRLLITLIFCSERILHQPLLYLSLFLKTNRQTYYDLLQRVRQTGDWEAWLNFFLQGVTTTAKQATQAARRITQLFKDDRTRIDSMGKAVGNTLRLHDLFQKVVVVSAPMAVRQLGLTLPTVLSALGRMEELGIIKEVTGKQRDRVYVYSDYLDILEEGTVVERTTV